jgi:glycosyltransferase involved in cell wall biosynthesis
MNAAPRLSIGLPVYNGEKSLPESLDALLGQSYGDFELIISDNASTDSTAEICRSYGKQDSRIRYIRQPRDIGRVPNHNFLIEQARGELFKWAACDDLYARDLLKRCVEALDEYPQVVLAHSGEAVIDNSGAVISLVKYPVVTDAPLASERFRSMLFDGWGDDSYGVIRTQVLRRTPRHGSYHLADRIFTTELALYGPFFQVPDWLFFRRDAPEMTFTVRERCAYMDPRRANRLRYPVARLYGEYALAYTAMIQRAPLTGAERRECYRHLAHWSAGRVLPVAYRALRRETINNRSPDDGPPMPTGRPVVSVADLVAGQERKDPGREPDRR